ncbi:MAG: TRAP transporter small permease [Burkholderiaceae bacterium]|nr:TRAP transporter small permease [Burkholderiaceae bacterium]
MERVPATLAVFCFLPWCHLKRGHAVVDLLWNAYPPALQRALLLAWDVLMFVAWTLLVWRMGVAMEDYRANVGLASPPQGFETAAGAH